MQSTREKVSYCIGLETGRNLQRQFSDLSFDDFLQGIQDSLAGAFPKLSQGEIESIMQSLARQREQQQRQYFSNLSAHNREKGEKFLEENKEKEGVQVLASGLQYKILNTGDGEKPTPADTVLLHYRSKFVDGPIFESSYERGKPHEIAFQSMIQGWSEAIQRMRVGDRWEIVVPHYMAYGEAGFAPQVGPGTTLIFEIELLGIK